MEVRQSPELEELAEQGMRAWRTGDSQWFADHMADGEVASYGTAPTPRYVMDACGLLGASTVLAGGPHIAGPGTPDLRSCALPELDTPAAPIGGCLRA